MKNIKRMLGIILAVGALCSSVGSVGAENAPVPMIVSIVNSLNCTVTVAIATGSHTSSSSIPAYGQITASMTDLSKITVTLPIGYVPTSGYTAPSNPSTNGYTASHTPAGNMNSLTVSSGGLIPSPSNS